MRGILINPNNRTIEEVTVNEDSCAEFSTLLACQYVERVLVSNRGDYLWIDEEGMLTDPNPNGYFRLGGHLFCGNGLLLGNRESEDGDVSADTNLPLDLVIATCQFHTRDELSDEELTPRFEISTLEFPPR